MYTPKTNTIRQIARCLLILGLMTPIIADISFKPEQNNPIARYLKKQPPSVPKKWLNTQLSQIKMTPRVLELIQKPGEDKPWHSYKPIFIQPKKIEAGKHFVRKHRDYLNKVSKKYGIPKEIITAIIGVETRYGQNKGHFVAIDAIATIAFYYPDRHKYFKSEFKALLELAYQQKWNLRDVKGSYAGALGIPQFMPSSYLNFAISETKQTPNLLNSEKDAILSIANYLKKRGKWSQNGRIVTQLNTTKRQETFLKNTMGQQKMIKLNRQLKRQLRRIGIKEVNTKQRVWVIQYKDTDKTRYAIAHPNFKSIMSYNNSHKYALAVALLAKELRQNP